MKLSSSKDSELLKVIPAEHLSRSSIYKGKELIWTERPHLGCYQSSFSLRIKHYQKTRKGLPNLGVGPPSMYSRTKYFTREISHLPSYGALKLIMFCVKFTKEFVATTWVGR